MEADAELRAFLRRDEHLAPTGFVTRVISACRNNQELRNDRHYHPAPITTIEQLKNSSWHYWHHVGKKSVKHLRYLFEKNWEDSTSAVAVDGTCKWCSETHRGMCPRVKTIEYYETGTVKRVEFITASCRSGRNPSMTTALADAGLQYSGLSWSGFAVFGDERSIAEVKRLQHLAGMVPDLQKQLAEAQRIPKLRSRRLR